MHGALLFAWLIFLIAQASLIRVRNVSVHRRLGWFGALLGIAIVISGVAVSLHATRRDLAAGGGDVVLGDFVGILITFLIFGSLIAAAIVLRRDSESHKRLLLLATIWILAPAWLRFRYFFPAVENPLVVFSIIADSLILVAIARDLMAYKRVHPVYVWVGGLMIAYDIDLLILRRPPLPECGLATGRTVAAWRSRGLTSKWSRRSRQPVRSCRRCARLIWNVGQLGEGSHSAAASSFMDRSGSLSDLVIRA